MDSIDVKEKKRKNHRDDGKKTKSKKSLDDFAVEKDSNATLNVGKRSLSMEAMKPAEDDISEMPSAVTAAAKKHKKGKEKDEKRYHQKTKDPSENAANVESETRVGKGSGKGLKDDEQSESMEGRKAAEDNNVGMPSTTVATNKKRKRSKEKEKDGDQSVSTEGRKASEVNNSGTPFTAVATKRSKEKDVTVEREKDGEQPESMEGRKAAEDNNSGMPSTTVATNKKRKKSKEKDATAEKEKDGDQSVSTEGRKASEDNNSGTPFTAVATKKKTKRSKEKDVTVGREKDSEQSESMKGRKAEDNNSGVSSTTVATNKERKKRKEKVKTVFSQITKGPSKILGDVEVEMAVEKDPSRSLEDGEQSLPSEGSKSIPDDTREMSSSATTTTKKKRKKSNGNGEKQYNKTTIGFSESALDDEHNTRRKCVQSLEANGNKMVSSMKKRKGTDDSEVSNLKKKLKSSKDDSNASSLQKKKKKVSFSNQVEVFHVGNETDDDENAEESLVRGKRFTIEEDNKVREAIDQYIQTHQLGEEGLQMILNCRKYPKVRNCWKEIGTCLPYRPYDAIYYRAHTLLERGEKRKWAPEEYEIVRRFYETHGADWKTLAMQLKKHRVHIKDCWRSIRLSNRNRGAWSQDEYQNLFDLVNLDLRLKAAEEIDPKHGMIKDNISWQSIGEKLSTRNPAHCCMKWYAQLTSPLVTEGLWGDVDDYRLLAALQNVDACCMEDVDWDNLLEHRSGEVCKTRWRQMTRHIGGSKEKPFIEQVEVLSKRYSTDMIEYREMMDSLKEQRKLKEEKKKKKKKSFNDSLSDQQ